MKQGKAELFVGKSDSSKDSFLEKAREAREERALEKKRENSAIVIQSRIRGWLARKNYSKTIL